MYSELITYENFNGETVKERFYFNITRTELQKQNMHTKGGLLNYLTRIIATKDQEEIANYFEKIIDMSYGVKTDDGNHFIKSKELTDKFKCSAAYDELFYRLTTEDEYASKFINGIMPKNMPEGNAKDAEVMKKKFFEETGFSESDLGVANENNNNTI